MKLKSKLGIATALAVACSALLGGCNKHNGFVSYQELDAKWSKWSQPKITSDQWNGTTIWQTRTNLDTGEVELRAQTASPKGGYN